MTRPHSNNPTRTLACGDKSYLNLVSVLVILMHVETTVGVFTCGQTVCEGKGFDTCQPHPVSGKICQPCRDFVEYCNSTRMPHGCNPYCLDQQRTEYEANFKNITIERDSLLRSCSDAQDNFVKEKAILLANITQDKMQNENNNLSKIINKAENHSTEMEDRLFDLTQRLEEEKSTKTHRDREYQDTTLTMILVAVISSVCTASVVILLFFLCDRIFKHKERSRSHGNV